MRQNAGLSPIVRHASARLLDRRNVVKWPGANCDLDNVIPYGKKYHDNDTPTTSADRRLERRDDDPPTGGPLKPEPHLVDAVALLFRPLARLCIENGLILASLEEMLKSALVDVASTEFGVGNAPPTDSRVSVLTGVHRKDVKRLRTQIRQGVAQSIALSLAAEVIAHWISDPAFHDRQGRPRPLPLAAHGKAVASFESLVIGVSRDVRPRVLLDELARVGAVDVAGDTVTLHGGSFVPQRGLAEKAFYFGRNGHDHLAACVHNLLGRQPPMLENSVFSHALSAESIERLASLTREQWQAMLQRLVAETAAAEARDTALGKTNRRMNIGIYFYHEDASAGSRERQASPSALPKRRRVTAPKGRKE
jgi:uncharacterized protein DUF6502